MHNGLTLMEIFFNNAMFWEMFEKEKFDPVACYNHSPNPYQILCYLKCPWLWLSDYVFTPDAIKSRLY